MTQFIWTYLHRTDGSVIASTTSDWPAGSKWEWISTRFAEDNDCSPDEIGCKEDELEGDLITAKGEVVGFIMNELRGFLGSRQ